MLSRRFCLLSVCLVLSFLIAFLGVSIDASAETVIYEQMSQADTRALLGDSLPFNITVDGVTTSDSFIYMSTYGGATLFNIETNPVFTNGNANFNYQNGRWLFYRSEAQHYDYMNKNVSIDMDLSLYASSGSMFYGGFGITLDSSVARDPLGSDNLINGHNYINSSFSAPAFGDAAANQDYYNTASITYMLWNNNTSDSYFRMFTYNDLSSVTSLHAEGKFYTFQFMILAVYCPYVYGSISSSAPVTETTVSTIPSSTTEINVNVDVDMTETNGILGAIRDLIANLGNFIVTGIKNLFIPSQEDLAAFKNTVEQLLRETFGGIPALEEQLEDAISGLFNVTAKTSIRFDGIQFDGHYYVPAQDVNLKPAGYDSLYTFVEMIINILATIAVINTSINQVKRVLVGEVVVDVD